LCHKRSLFIIIITSRHLESEQQTIATVIACLTYACPHNNSTLHSSIMLTYAADDNFNPQ